VEELDQDLDLDDGEEEKPAEDKPAVVENPT